MNKYKLQGHYMRVSRVVLLKSKLLNVAMSVSNQDTGWLQNFQNGPPDLSQQVAMANWL